MMMGMGSIIKVIINTRKIITISRNFMCKIQEEDYKNNDNTKIEKM